MMLKYPNSIVIIKKTKNNKTQYQFFCFSFFKKTVVSIQKNTAQQWAVTLLKISNFFSCMGCFDVRTPVFIASSDNVNISVTAALQNYLKKQFLILSADSLTNDSFDYFVVNFKFNLQVFQQIKQKTNQLFTGKSAQGVNFLAPGNKNTIYKDHINYFIGTKNKINKPFYELMRQAYEGGDNSIVHSTTMFPKSYDVNSHYTLCMLSVLPTTNRRVFIPQKTINLDKFVGFANISLNPHCTKWWISSTMLSASIFKNTDIRVYKCIQTEYAILLKNLLWYFFYLRYVPSFNTDFLAVSKTALVKIYGWLGLKKYDDSAISSSHIYMSVFITDTARLHLEQFKNINYSNIIYTDTDNFVLKNPLRTQYQNEYIGGLKNTSKDAVNSLLSYFYSKKIYISKFLKNYTVYYKTANRSLYGKLNIQKDYDLFDNQGAFVFLDNSSRVNQNFYFLNFILINEKKIKQKNSYFCYKILPIKHHKQYAKSDTIA